MDQKSKTYQLPDNKIESSAYLTTTKDVTKQASSTNIVFPNFKLAIQESQKFLKDCQLRVCQMKTIQDQIDIGGDQIRSGSYKPRNTIKNFADQYQQLEDTFKSHKHYFKQHRKQTQQKDLIKNKSEQLFSRTANTVQENFNQTTEETKSTVFLNGQSPKSINNRINKFYIGSGSSSTLTKKKIEFFPQNMKSFDDQRKLNRIITEVSQVVEELLPNIQVIKQQDKTIYRQYQSIEKEMNRDLSLNATTWQNDQRYQDVKNYLRELQEEKNLPEYFRFCLLNTRSNLKDVKRPKQEIKETRFLWYKLKKEGKSDNDMYKSEEARETLEKILKKFYRIKQNQFLTQGPFGWHLNSKKEDRNLTSSEMEYQLLIENLQFDKVGDLQQRKKMLQKNEEDIRQNMLHEQQLKFQTQLSPITDGIVKRNIEKIYKTTFQTVDTLEKEGQVYRKYLDKTAGVQQSTNANIQNAKAYIEQVKTGIRRTQTDVTKK